GEHAPRRACLVVEGGGALSARGRRRLDRGGARRVWRQRGGGRGLGQRRGRRARGLRVSLGGERDEQRGQWERSHVWQFLRSSIDRISRTSHLAFLGTRPLPRKAGGA